MIIDGKKIAQKIYSGLQEQVAALPFVPIFCDIVVGNDPVSLSYVNIKGKTAKKIGLEFMMKQFPEDIGEQKLLAEIEKLNNVSGLCGLIVQLPLPQHLDRQKVLDAIKPEIDVDCIGAQNSQKFYSGETKMLPPTAAGVLHILDSLNLELENLKILVLGQGELVGKPVSFLLKQKNLQVQTADRNTENLKQFLKEADVVISGTGQAGLIKGQDIKKGSIIIDAGTAESGGGIVGDVDFESAQDIAGYISPVPGGVGPVTVAKLLQNVVAVAQRKN